MAAIPTYKTTWTTLPDADMTPRTGIYKFTSLSHTPITGMQHSLPDRVERQVAGRLALYGAELEFANILEVHSLPQNNLATFHRYKLG
ncbi:hypothetical protein scyTo_0011748 [Scyliorhinus torazame]|uniref:Uncharacterized protein n=1 Tax=Scyliorhinus torazame TaxID=75743 RepID=A0A401NUB1_SCYTO|nr:hypothetical protein [Scyliorhinus torazame]